MPKEVTNEELARMVAKGFEGVDEQFEGVGRRFDIVEKKLEKHDQHFKHIDNRLDHLDARMGRMEADLDDIKGNIVYRFEFNDPATRVKYIESKLAIESGK